MQYNLLFFRPKATYNSNAKQLFCYRHERMLIRFKQNNIKQINLKLFFKKCMSINICV